jgi:hypothetical protein
MAGRNVLIVSVLLPIAVNFALRSKTQRRIEVLGMRSQTVLMHVASGALTVVCDGQVDDQAPAGRLIAQVVADFHVSTPLACAFRYAVLRADRVSGRAEQATTAPTRPLASHAPWLHLSELCT